MKKETEIIVVGAGVIGLACAWRLAKEGRSVLLVEQKGAVAGASSFSLGVLSPPSPVGESCYHRLHRQSLRMCPEFAQEVEQESGVKINYRHTGSLEIIPTENQYIQAVREIAACRERELVFNKNELLLISPEEVRELEPEVSTTPFGAIYNEKAAQLDVDQLLLGLRGACLSRGVRFLEGVKVEQLDSTKGEGVSAITSDGVIKAAQAVVCAGAWTPFLNPLLRRFAAIEPVRGQGILVRAPRRLTQRIIKWDCRYVVPVSDDHYILGSTTEEKVGFDAVTTEEGLRSIWTAVKQSVPALAPAVVERAWAGLRPAMADSRPCIGTVPGAEGLFVAAGHYKTGFGWLPMTVKIIVELVNTGATVEELTGISPREIDGGQRKKNG